MKCWKRGKKSMSEVTPEPMSTEPEEPETPVGEEVEEPGTVGGGEPPSEPPERDDREG